MTKYQRDRASLSTYTRLIKCIPYLLLLPFKRNSELHQWKVIVLSDCLRIVGFHRLSIAITKILTVKNSQQKNKFWQLHVRGVSLHYAGKNEAAEQTFIESQAYAEDLELSYSFQHLGKLKVETGNYYEAADLFKKALEIRNSLGKADLIASTERALSGIHCPT